MWMSNFQRSPDLLESLQENNLVANNRPSYVSYETSNGVAKRKLKYYFGTSNMLLISEPTHQIPALGSRFSAIGPHLSALGSHLSTPLLFPKSKQPLQCLWIFIGVIPYIVATFRIFRILDVSIFGLYFLY